RGEGWGGVHYIFARVLMFDGRSKIEDLPHLPISSPLPTSRTISRTAAAAYYPPLAEFDERVVRGVQAVQIHGCGLRNSHPRSIALPFDRHHSPSFCSPHL
ncbi:hypothetical protein, partial [Microcoleus sp. herbarium13]|uniref:hypothetical protein n=1 Tax=Microcoleus sp. herbarium13 TaxID=3055438 RepID=UPI002FD4C44E